MHAVHFGWDLVLEAQHSGCAYVPAAASPQPALLAHASIGGASVAAHEQREENGAEEEMGQFRLHHSGEGAAVGGGPASQPPSQRVHTLRARLERVGVPQVSLQHVREAFEGCKQEVSMDGSDAAAARRTGRKSAAPNRVPSFSKRCISPG